jgi:hypothetical protein
MSVGSNPVTQCHIPDNPNPQVFKVLMTEASISESLAMITTCNHLDLEQQLLASTLYQDNELLQLYLSHTSDFCA